MDYGLWHSQPKFIEDLAHQANFFAATAISRHGVVENRSRHMAFWNHVDRLKRPDRENPVAKAMKAQMGRLLRPYSERAFKPVLAECDLYGIDHRVPCGATPLMMAARAGNLALAEALIERGADLTATDEYGHTAWMVAFTSVGWCP
jgi:hypothetical protein